MGKTVVDDNINMSTCGNPLYISRIHNFDKMNLLQKSIILHSPTLFCLGGKISAAFFKKVDRA